MRRCGGLPCALRATPPLLRAARGPRIAARPPPARLRRPRWPPRHRRQNRCAAAASGQARLHLLLLSLVRGAAAALLPALAPAVASRAGHARRPRPLLSLGAAWQQPRWPSLIGASLPRTAPPAMPHAGSGPPPAAPSSPALLGLAPPCRLRPPPPRLPPPAVLLELGSSCSDGRLLAAEASGCPLPACGSLSYHQCISWRPATDLISLPLTLTTAQVNRTRDTLLCQ